MWCARTRVPRLACCKALARTAEKEESETRAADATRGNKPTQRELPRSAAVTMLRAGADSMQKPQAPQNTVQPRPRPAPDSCTEQKKNETDPLWAVQGRHATLPLDDDWLTVGFRSYYGRGFLPLFRKNENSVWEWRHFSESCFLSPLKED